MSVFCCIFAIETDIYKTKKGMKHEDEIKEIRQLIEHGNNYTSKNIANREFHNFAGLRKEDTGLGVDIFLDQCNSYKEFDHPFWLYFRNSYGNLNEFIPITIEEKRPLFGNIMPNVFHKDIVKIIRFIATYVDDIYRISKGEMDVYDLYRKIKRLSESPNPKILLTEMSKLSNEMTGLPFDIWVGINQKQHGVGVKFAPDNSTTNSSNFPEMSVPDCKIISSKKYEAWREKYVKALIEANKESLIQLGNNPQLYAHICGNLTKIDANCKPIKNEPEWHKVGNAKFGYTKVINKEGKYNFIDTNGQIIFKDKWFDTANDFTKNQDGTIRAYTRIDNTDGFLYLNPTRWVQI